MPSVPHIAFGAGPPVLLIHGFAGYKEGWGGLPQRLAAAGHRVICLDLPLTRAGRQERLRAVEAALTALGPAVLVGHSLGCRVALACAARRPELVRGLVLLAPHLVAVRLRGVPRGPLDLARLPLVGVPALATAIAAIQRDRGHLRRLLLAAVAHPEDLRPGTAEARLLDEAVAHLATLPARALARWAVEDLASDGLAGLWNVTAPVTAIVGARDRVAPAEHGERLRHALPQTHVVTLAEVGHFPHIEALESVGELSVAALGAPLAAAP